MNTECKFPHLNVSLKKYFKKLAHSNIINRLQHLGMKMLGGENGPI